SGLRSVLGAGTDPHSPRGGDPKLYRLSGNQQGNGLVVVLSRPAERRSRTQPARIQIFEQLPIALVDADNLQLAGRGHFIERHPSAAPAVLRRVAAHDVAVRASLAFPQKCVQAALEILGDAVLEALGFVV